MPIPLSENKKRFFKKLNTIKGRRENSLFIVEGERALKEILKDGTFHPSAVIATDEWFNANTSFLPDTIKYSVKERDLKDISNMSSAVAVLAVFTIPEIEVPAVETLKPLLSLALDDVQDPGNLGTIIRLADWWGIEYIICSKLCVDCYNPKVVQSAMGALTRVKVVKIDDITAFLNKCRKEEMNIYGTFLGGENLFTAPLGHTGIIVMGNEGNGISQEVEKIITRKITIPSYPIHKEHVESLNVAMATGIVLSCFRRKNFS